MIGVSLMLRFILLFVVMFYSSFASSNSSNTLTIEGTGDSQELLRGIANLYTQKYPNHNIIIPQSVGSGGGIKKVLQNECEVARVARTLKQKEEASGLSYLLFGYSPIVFVINTDKKNINLSIDDIVAIYSGKVTQWEEIENSHIAGKIYVINREDGDSSKTIIENNIPQFKNIKTAVGITAFYNAEAISLITKYKNTIGYLPMPNIQHTNLSIVAINNIYPNITNIQKKDYKLLTPFGLVYKENLSNIAKSFIEFLKTQEIKEFMLSQGVISNF